MRSRFISTFKRDKVGCTTESDLSIIGEGNTLAHGGDAVADTLLYTGIKKRSDHDVFEKLYGMHPGIVMTIGKSFAIPKNFKLTCSDHKPTISVLNTHATVIASKHKVGSNEFCTCFREFVTLFTKSGYDEGYLKEGNWTDVTSAYWAFVKCTETEVTMIKVVDTKG